MFLPKTELHGQLAAWEAQQEKGWEDMRIMKEKLTTMVRDLHAAKGGLTNMSNHALAL